MQKNISIHKTCSPILALKNPRSFGLAKNNTPTVHKDTSMKDRLTSRVFSSLFWRSMYIYVHLGELTLPNYRIHDVYMCCYMAL